MTDIKTAKVFKRADYSVFEMTVRELGKSASIVCEALGYAPGSWKSWEVDKKMPQVAAIACEALRRRVNGEAKGLKVWLVKTTTQSQADTIAAMCRGLNVEFTDI